MYVIFPKITFFVTYTLSKTLLKQFHRRVGMHMKNASLKLILTVQMGFPW